LIAFWYKFAAVVGGEKIIPTILGRGSGDEIIIGYPNKSE
jgi:hypothetical protein